MIDPETIMVKMALLDCAEYCRVSEGRGGESESWQ
jgi:hypothetical protein